jgi:hypothetical protein
MIWTTQNWLQDTATNTVINLLLPQNVQWRNQLLQINSKLVFRKWVSVSPLHATSCAHCVDVLLLLNCLTYVATFFWALLHQNALHHKHPLWIKHYQTPSSKSNSHTLSNTLHQSNTPSCTINRKASLKPLSIKHTQSNTINQTHTIKHCPSIKHTIKHCLTIKHTQSNSFYQSNTQSNTVYQSNTHNQTLCINETHNQTLSVNQTPTINQTPPTHVR